MKKNINIINLLKDKSANINSNIVLANILKSIDKNFKIKDDLLKLENKSTNANTIKKILTKQEINEFVKENYKQQLPDISWEDLIKDLMISYYNWFLLFHYGVRIQTQRLWNDLTLQLRGVMLDVKNDFSIHFQAFEKFFNLWEVWIEQTKIENIPKNISFDAVDKLDWSMWLLFKDRDWQYKITTKWSFYSQEWILWTNILYLKYKQVITSRTAIIDKYFLMFEIITPENKIVLDYGYTNDIFLIWARDKKTFKLLNQNQLNDLALQLWFKRPEIYAENYKDLKTFIEKVYNSKDKFMNKEGSVLYFSNWLIVKVKTKQYVELHKQADWFGYKKVIKLIIEKWIEKYTEDIAEEFIEDAEDIKIRALSIVEIIIKDAFERFLTIIKPYRKDSFISLNKEIKVDNNYDVIIKKVVQDILVEYFKERWENNLFKDKKETKQFYREYLQNKKIFILKLLLDNKYFDNLFSKSKVIMLVWIPASWKSTLAQLISKQNNWYIISLDEIRKKQYWTYKITDKERNNKVVDIAIKDLKQQLEKIKIWESRTIILDLTNTKKKFRKQWLDIIYKYSVPVEAIQLNIHPMVAIQLDLEREKDKQVWKQVIYRMFHNLEFIEKSEKINKLKFENYQTDNFKQYIHTIWNSILEILKLSNNNKNINKEVVVKMHKIIWDNLNTFFEYKEENDIIKDKHKSPYHLEDFKTHITNVVLNTILLTNDINTIVASIFHDIWKVYAMKYLEKLSRYIFQWHEYDSWKVWQLVKEELSNYLKQFNINIDDEVVWNLIRHHDIFNQIAKKVDENCNNENFINDINEVLNKQWLSQNYLDKLLILSISDSLWFLTNINLIYDKDWIKKLIDTNKDFKQYNTKIQQFIKCTDSNLKLWILDKLNKFWYL